MISGQKEHKHHEMRQFNRAHPKQDHNMEIGSMAPLPINTKQEYLAQKELLPTEEARKV